MGAQCFSSETKQHYQNQWKEFRSPTETSITVCSHMNDRKLSGTGSPKLSPGQSKNNSTIEPSVANRCTLGHLMFSYEPRLFCKAVHNLSTTYPSLEQNTLHSDKKDQCRTGNTAKMTGLNTGQRWRVHGLWSHKGRVVKIFFLFLCCKDVNKQTLPHPHPALWTFIVC